jgi:hypothetical protein
VPGAQKRYERQPNRFVLADYGGGDRGSKRLKPLRHRLRIHDLLVVHRPILG